MRPMILALVAASALGPADAAPAQVRDTRYELGQRLRQFERVWERLGDTAERRARVVGPMARAVGAFFSFRLAEAARELDRARHAALGAEPTSNDRWLDALRFAPTARLVDREAELALNVSRIYRPDLGDDAIALPLQVTVRDAAGRAIGEPIRVDLTRDESRQFAIPLPRALATGDYRLEIAAGADTEPRRRAVSVVTDAKARIDALNEIAARYFKARVSIESATLRGLARTLRTMVRGGAFETDLPAARLVREAEAVADAIAKDRGYYGPARSGQFWLRLPTPRGTLPVRIQVPETVDDDGPRPLVLALHGAGGSENLFFDGYGDGLAARLCTERGWYLAAPRNLRGATAQACLDALCERFPIDPKRVLVVGHSMGAATAIGIMQLRPDAFAAVAALGGGGGVKRERVPPELPVFVGCGSADFALRGARGLARALRAAGTATVRESIYDDVEHMLIVQVALPDVFAFFDEQLR